MKRILFLLIIICILITLPMTAKASNMPDALPAPVASVQALGIASGAHIRPTGDYNLTINNFNATASKPIAILMYFTDWSGDPNNTTVFDAYLANLIMKVTPAPVIMLSWQPMSGSSSEGCDKDYGLSIPLSDITSGKCDRYITAFATELSQRPERYLLRFAHEMNITDSPWWPGHYGQNASAYVAMWKHVHDVVASVQSKLGKHNIEWVWSINYASNPPDAWNAIPNYYPGNTYVDWIGLSGYNWYNAPGHSMPWKSFSNLYDAVLKNLACMYAKPQIITEIGSVGTAAEKAAWIQDAYSKMPRYPFLRGVVWFNDFANATQGQADFRVMDIPQISPVNTQVTNAYKSSISSASYVSTLPALNVATPGESGCPKRIYLPRLTH